MQELKDGQKTALDFLMERWELPIKAYIYRQTQDIDWVDELAQETFVKVYVNASGFDTHRRFSPWIYTIATNLCHNWRRWRVRHPSYSPPVETDENPLDRIEDPEESFVSRLEQNEHCSDLKKAIASLPDSLKTTLILYYYQGLSYGEIAESLHCSPRGVETRLYRARKILHSTLVSLVEA